MDLAFDMTAANQAATTDPELMEFISHTLPLFQGMSGEFVRLQNLINARNEEIRQRQAAIDNELNDASILGLNGLSLQIVSGFITVLGVWVVALSFTALLMSAAGFLPSAAPAAAGMFGGFALISLGMYGISRGAREQAYEEMHDFRPVPV